MLIVDAEHDPYYRFDAYRKLKDAVERDRQLCIMIDIPEVEKIANGTNAFAAAKPVMEGRTMIEGNTYGKIYYMKLSLHNQLLGDQMESIKPYAGIHPAFPQESTADQYFEPAQFIAYRALGCAIARTLRIDITS